MKRWGLALVLLSALAGRSAAAADAVATFHSIGLSWSPPGGSAGTAATVRYRPMGGSPYVEGLPLWFDARNGEYRGSLVQLEPGTTYEIELTHDADPPEVLSASTWPAEFPIGQTITLPGGETSTPLVLDAATYSGSASGYTLITAPPEGATIDVADGADDCVVIQASFVILRGVTIRGCAVNGIVLDGAHDVVIERNDISGWGRISGDGWGVNGDAALRCDHDESVERIVVQRNRIHHPRADSNNWGEPRPDYGDNPHPAGPQAMYFEICGGNHVIRYNQFDSDADHYFNDILGGAENFSEDGFPRADSDIYGNILQNCWDDGIESEGSNENVRIWGNFIDQTMVKVAVASTAIGPVYIWRNIAALARTDDNVAPDDEDRGPFLKAGNSGGFGGGRIYVFHNTLLQPVNPDGMGLPFGCGGGIADAGGPLEQVVSRNNILQNHKDWWSSISDGSGDPTNDYDYDLYNGVVPNGTEANGWHGTPAFAAANGSGEYALDPASLGFDAGQVLPGFNDGFAGTAPDVGAFEAGSPPMEFGVDAYDDEPTGAGGAGGAGGGSTSAGIGGGSGGPCCGAANMPAEDGGCGCRVTGAPRSDLGPRVLFLAAFLFALSRVRVHPRRHACTATQPPCGTARVRRDRAS
jgi:hypothetical protein